MYSASEQFADLSKTNYANAVEPRIAVARECGKDRQAQPEHGEGRAGARRAQRASGRVGQGRPGTASRFARS